MTQLGLDRDHPPEHSFYAHALEPLAPATGVDASTAEAFCRFMGKSLPTLDEWRKAFRGGVSLDAEGMLPNPAPKRQTVWAETRPKPPANFSDTEDPYESIAPVGSFPEDRSPYGVLDMAGNVTEWTATIDSNPIYRNLRVLAGGRWDAPASLRHYEITWVNHLKPNRTDFATGLRCVERTGAEQPVR